MEEMQSGFQKRVNDNKKVGLEFCAQIYGDQKKKDQQNLKKAYSYSLFCLVIST